MTDGAAVRVSAGQLPPDDPPAPEPAGYGCSRYRDVAFPSRSATGRCCSTWWYRPACRRTLWSSTSVAVRGEEGVVAVDRQQLVLPGWGLAADPPYHQPGGELVLRAANAV